MKKVFRKIMLLAVAFIMLFAVVGLTACDNPSDYSNPSDTPLSPKRELQARKDYLYVFGYTQAGLTIEDVCLRYFGTYNDWVVVSIQPWREGVWPAFRYVTIAGFEFIFFASVDYLVWKDGQFYEWEHAFNRRILSRTAIGKIHYHWNNLYTASCPTGCPICSGA